MTLAEARRDAIEFEERALDSLRKQLADTKEEVAELEDAQDEISKRLEVLRTETGEGYSSAVFHAELAQHGCIACASIRAGGGHTVRVHNGVGPECPRRTIA